MKAALLGCLLALAAGVAPASAAASSETSPLGPARISLIGRPGCAKRGLLAAHKCGQGDSLSLWAGGADAWTTWRIEAAPSPAPGSGASPLVVTLKVVGRDSAVGRCPASKLTGHIGCDDKSVNMGGGSRWVLERAVAGTNLYRIRMQGRVTGRCRRTYLGAVKGAGASCGAPRLAVYAADDPTVAILWHIEALASPSPPPPRRASPPPSPSPSPPPPKKSHPPPSSPPPPPPPKPSPPPPRPSPPPPPSPSPPPPRPSPPPPSPLPPPPSPSPPPPSPSPPPPSPSPPLPSPSPPPPSPSPPSPSPPPPSPSPPPPSPSPPPPGCFPGHAAVLTADGSTKSMAELRTGDRVQAVDWAGRTTFEEIYYWQHIEPSAVVSYATLAVVDASGASRTLQLSMTHYLPASHDPSGACSALAAADAAGASAADAALPAWSTAALHLSWREDHVMVLPPAVHTGMVAWALGRNGTAQPACIVSVDSSLEAGAFSPIVRARGIVVDGVVASPFTRWNPVWGRGLLPTFADPLVPALAHAALTPVHWAYKLMGPQLAWRINNHRLLALGPGLVANAVVWGPVLLLVAAAAALAAGGRPKRAGTKVQRT